MALTYTIETSSKFSLFYEDPIDQAADANELLAKIKKEKDEQRLAKEKAKKVEKEKLKKEKQCLPQINESPQSTSQIVEETKVENIPITKSPRVPVARSSDQHPKFKPYNQLQAENFEQPDVPQEGNSEQPSRPPERVFRGFSFRGSRGRGRPRRDDNQFEAQNTTPQGESTENFEDHPRRGFRGIRRTRGRGMRYNSRPPFSRPFGSSYNGSRFSDRQNEEDPNSWRNEMANEHEQPVSTENPTPFEPEVPSIPEPIDVHAATHLEHNQTINDENSAPPAQPEETKASDVPEEQELTVAEYFAKKDSERQRLESMQQALQKKSRKKMNMSEKVADFSGMVPYIKKNWDEEETEEEEDGEEMEMADDQKRKHTLEVPFVRGEPRPNSYTRGGFRPNRPFRGSRGRGGSGGFRGARGGGAPGQHVRGRGYGGVVNSPRQEAVYLRLDSDLDFPSLGAE